MHQAVGTRGQYHTTLDCTTKYTHNTVEYDSVCLLVGIGTLPPPLSPASVPLPTEPKEGAHSPVGEGLGEFQFRRLEKKLSTAYSVD